MLLYILIFAFVTIMYLLSLNSEENSRGVMIFLMVALGIFVGLGDMLGGYDRYIYADLFDGCADTMRSEFSVWDSTVFELYASEPGYGLINVLIGFLTRNRYIFIFIYTLVCYLLILRAFLRYTNRSPFVVVAFMGLWFFFTFTYLRQVLASAVAWQAVDFIAKRRPVPFFTLTLIAATIHNSALLFIPVYFLPIRKPNMLMVTMLLVSCLIVGLTNIPESITGAFADSAEMQERIMATGVAEDLYAETGGVRLEYLLEAVVFLSIIFWRYDYFDENNKFQIIMLNMALIFCGMLLFFIKSANGGRMSWFFMIGIITTISQLATAKNDFGFFNIGLIALFATLYIRILVSWDYYVFPYKTFFTNGHRQDDWIFRVYEYDWNYDYDKFYR